MRHGMELPDPKIMRSFGLLFFILKSSGLDQHDLCPRAADNMIILYLEANRLSLDSSIAILKPIPPGNEHTENSSRTTHGAIE